MESGSCLAAAGYTTCMYSSLMLTARSSFALPTAGVGLDLLAKGPCFCPQRPLQVGMKEKKRQRKADRQTE